MPRASINPTLLQWARDRSDLSFAQVAQKIGVREDYVRLLEEGGIQPTFRQTQDLARALHIPLGYLFLSNPPQTVLPIADFRTLPQAQHGHFSPELEETLNDAFRKRDWLQDWRTKEGIAPFPYVGRFSIQTPYLTVVENIRQTLNLPSFPAMGLRRWEDHFRFLVSRAEEAGILVLQNGVALGDNRRHLSVEEFRGFALVDPLAPIIFINSRDTVAGRIFTLAHEFGHIWSGTGGISNPSMFDVAATPEVERFCNRVAAEILVPRELFIRKFQEQIENDLLEKSQNLAHFFLVSVFVILIREVELGIINREEFRASYDEALDQIEAPVENLSEGANFYNTWRVRNGRVLIRELLIALRQGNVLYREAAQLLNVRPRTLEGIMQRF